MLTHAFPTAERLAELDPETLPMPRARGRALVSPVPPRWPPATCASTAVPTATTSAWRCWRCPGIGPWTADYIALRALGHPDVFLPTDIGIRDALRRVGRDPAEASAPRRGVASLALLRPAAPVAHPRPRDPEGELTCGP